MFERIEIMLFFTEMSLLGRLAFIATTLAAIGGMYGLWHHHIYKAGEDACQARYTAAAAQQATKANKEIATEKVKYAQLDQDLQKSTGFSHPVSPLVADAIGRMPAPHSRSK